MSCPVGGCEGHDPVCKTPDCNKPATKNSFHPRGWDAYVKEHGHNPPAGWCDDHWNNGRPVK